MAGFWWVAQGRSKNYGIVWAPEYGKNGRRVAHWSRVSEALPGDIVFHYSSGALMGVSQVRERAHVSDPPSPAEEAWSGRGLNLPVEFVPFDLPLPLEEIPYELRAPGGPKSPFNKNRRMKQGYFFATPQALAEEIMSQYGLQLSYTGAGASEEIRVNGATDREALTMPKLRSSRFSPHPYRSGRQSQMPPKRPEA